MTSRTLIIIRVAVLVTFLCSVVAAAPKLVPQRITLANGKSFELNLPEGFSISIAAQGLKRVRFMARSPDHRIFVTDMYNLTDNKRGVVYILDEFDPVKHEFKKATKYLTGLRNPNSVAFYTDQAGTNWFYLALTDRLVRYRYEAGSVAPSGEPEVLATFPDYGLGYKYGGWHLTRTIAVGDNGKIYVSVGSSCNACEEKEEVRATIVEMDADGKNQRYYARGLRNAVGLRWIDGRLWATNMGSDHLGDNRPADTFYSIEGGKNYGWPYCFHAGARVFADPKFNPANKKLDCRRVPVAHTPFPAHSSPLGLEYFDSTSDPALANSFLVALHGSTKRNLRRGYSVVKIAESKSGAVEDFINGFFDGTKINGRPADIFRFDKNGFLLTDDYSGVVYYIYRKS
ncbi:MAG TPA: PQQ-dependent sugar dehydrogenase [Pyrinomonadaceae bacterium]|nr:PQQ-dependent sugar dehydrogenase [Pyrinomonadaceae bacterium]